VLVLNLLRFPDLFARKLLRLLCENLSFCLSWIPISPSAYVLVNWVGLWGTCRAMDRAGSAARACISYQ